MTVLALLLLAIVVAGVSITQSTLTGLAGGEQDNVATAVTGDGVKQASWDTNRNVVKRSVVPAVIYTALQTVASQSTPDLGKLNSAMAAAGFTSKNNDPGLGAVAVSSGTYALGTDEVSKADQAAVKARYHKALTAYGLSGDTADRVFEQAQQWAIGAANSCPANGTGSDSAGSNSGSASPGTPGTLSAEQQQNAVTIIGVAKTIFPQDAQKASIVGIATALQESGLRNINYGDRDSLGLFQQRANWGTAEQRTTPAYAAAKFFLALAKVNGWQDMEVTKAAQAVQISAFPAAYQKHVATATAAVTALLDGSPAIPIPAAAGGSGAAPSSSGSSAPGSGSKSSSGGTNVVCAGDSVTTGTAVSADAQGAAKALLQAIASGKLTFLDTGPRGAAQQIKWAAEGTSPENCTVHLGVLQLMQVALSTFGTVQVSSLNRACSGAISISNYSTSPHSANGGGRAVDFSGFGGTATTGADANALRMLRTVAPMVPDGNHFGYGQSECRSSAGTSYDMPGAHQFSDYCNHLHLDFGNKDDFHLKGGPTS